jgi:hypothetical protein
VETAAPISVGTQVAIVVDASKDIEGRRDDIVKAVDELLLRPNDPWLDTAKRQEQMTVIVPKGENDYAVALPLDARASNGWTSDGMRIHNAVYTHDYKTASAYTALHSMLLGALVHMKDVPDFDQRPKFIVVFSDGIDVMSAVDVSDVILRAQSLRVTILSVCLGSADVQHTKNLQRMAEMTAGAMAVYAGSDLASLWPLYSTIRSQKTQYEVTYRSVIARSGDHGLQVGVMVGGNEFRSAMNSFAANVLPPTVQITEPTDDVVYERRSDQPGADRRAFEPREQAIKFKVAFPDGHPRRITEVYYAVDGVVLSTRPPDQLYIWDFSALPAGEHSIRVEAKDEQGLIGVSEPVRVTINIQDAPLPTATVPPMVITVVPSMPIVQPTVQPTVRTQSYLTTLALALAAMAAVVALYVLVAKPRVAKNVSETLINAVREATRVLSSRDRVRRLRARLVELNDDDTRGKTHLIYSQMVTLGRDPSKAKVVFPDNPTVSRLHARITEETTGIFAIHDEGGPNGTYVNDAPVPMEGTILHPGDLIGMGELLVVFELAGDSDQAREGSGSSRPSTTMTPRGNGGEGYRTGTRLPVARDDRQTF